MDCTYDVLRIIFVAFAVLLVFGRNSRHSEQRLGRGLTSSIGSFKTGLRARHEELVLMRCT